MHWDPKDSQKVSDRGRGSQTAPEWPRMLARRLWRVLAVLGRREQRCCLGSLLEWGRDVAPAWGSSLGETAPAGEGVVVGGPALRDEEGEETGRVVWLQQGHWARARTSWQGGCGTQAWERVEKSMHVNM